ncbi:nudix hydrolase 12, mitochondrial-like isoform X1 [Pistacia vera]|uniref:nudix hydrolase 12, mitochondrial-like isoform X1 n=2 Tax=Pistacia vera TaxID=55513 RepID=UPI001262B4B0|nr:nudix hydrolase 12, mitochondrial-like isoform X1 [Pistacia vera]
MPLKESLCSSCCSCFLSSSLLTNLNFMSSLEARTGRLRQRYDENNLRLVSGCIPYRLTKDDGNQNDDIENKIEVAMVSSPNRSDLVFPKGGWENDETVIEAACREALEEAGVKGILRENPLGVWEFRSKSRQDLLSQEGGCKGYMFALEVTEELESWPEQENRCRKWLNIKDAFELCRYEWMREALEAFLGVMAKEEKIETEEEKVDPPTTSPLSEVVAECQIISSSNCYVNPSSSQHHSINALSAFPWQITLKRFPLT